MTKQQKTLNTAVKFALVVLFLIILFFMATRSNGADFRRAETFEDAFGAACRVSVSGARGTGFFIGAVGNDAYIVTNYHVVTKNQVGTLDFWTNGKKESITGRVEWRYYDADMPGDFAVFVVDADELKEIDPPFLALGGVDAKPSIGAFIISCGAPDGRFPQAWKGQILEYYSGKTAIFSPPPVPGQSGSPICEFVDGELFVTGILTWLIGEKGRDDSKGGAIPIMNLYQALKRRPSNVDFHEPGASPIPPDATECAETVVSALEFYSDDCAACLAVAPEIVKLENEGIVERVNTDTAQGGVFAEQCGVTELPTVVILAGDRIEKTVSYDEMKRLGTRRAVVNAVDSVKARYPYESEIIDSFNAIDEQPPKVEPEKKAEPEPTKIPSFRKPDFREREPVHENARDVGIFEDSEARWRDRGAKTRPTPLKPRPKAEPPQVQEPPQIQEPPEEPPEESPEPKADEELPRSGGRIFGGNRKGIIGGAQDNLFKKYSAELDKFVDAQIGKVLTLINASKRAIFYFILFAVVVGTLIADLFKKLIRLILAKGESWWNALVAKAAEAAQIQAQYLAKASSQTADPQTTAKKTPTKK